MQQRVGLARAFATDAADPADGRAVLGARPADPHPAAGRAAASCRTSCSCTIVFVSHDLDEAVKLGNTIAIMEGGRIVQTGRPEDIVLRPANDYVADFVAHLNPLSVLTRARRDDRRRRPGRPGARHRARRRRCATRCRSSRDSDAPVWVGDDGATMGVILPATICALLARQPTA